MIITWLPLDNYSDSVKTLSDTDLAMQQLHILALLEYFHDPEDTVLPEEYKPGDKLGPSHPSVRMWKGFDLQLCELGLTACDEESRRLGVSSSTNPAYGYIATHMEWALTDTSIMGKPNWLGMEEFHASHRAVLLKRDWKHYKTYYQASGLPVLKWPVSEHA